MTLAVSRAGLTEQQAAFVEAYLECPNVSQAALKAGYRHVNAGYAAIKTIHVQRAIADARARMIESEGATLAYQTLVDCMKPGNPGSVRVAAAKVVWQAAGILEKGANQVDKPLADMTADELQAAIAKMDEQLTKVADGAKPIKPTVIEG